MPKEEKKNPLTVAVMCYAFIILDYLANPNWSEPSEASIRKFIFGLSC